MSIFLIRRSAVIAIACAVISMATAAAAQTASTPGFVSGPLTWTPTLTISDAGVDSNVFNSFEDPKEDVTGAFIPRVNAALNLPYLRMETIGGAEYQYFERYKNERALNGNVNSRVTLPFRLFQPAVFGSWAHARDRSGNELDVRARHTDTLYGAGLGFALATRVNFNLSGSVAKTRYDQGQDFRGVDIATQLNRQSMMATGSARITMTPFTSLLLDASVSQDEFALKPVLNTDNLRGDVGFEFSPDAVISGRAFVGYRAIYPERNISAPDGARTFFGVTSSVDLSYTLLGRTRFNPRIARDATYSVSGTTPYYVSTVAGMQITQTLFGPLQLLLRGDRERMQYPATPLEAARTDTAETWGGGLAIRVSARSLIAFNYDQAQRRSPAEPLFNFHRRHIYTTITYGF
jgi:hypothetical protein